MYDTACRIIEMAMNTIHIDIRYRPMRLGCVIKSGCLDEFRKAARLNYALWGGKYNPILLWDNRAEAKQIADLYGIDGIAVIGDNISKDDISLSFPHLGQNIAHNKPFLSDEGKGNRSQLLDVHNLIIHLARIEKLGKIKEKKFITYKWTSADSLSDIFLLQFGCYPTPDEVNTDYREIISKAVEAEEYEIPLGGKFPSEMLQHLSIASFSGYGLLHQYPPMRWSNPGYFIGKANNIEDLICFWNIRAAKIPILFIDLDYLSRYDAILPIWHDKLTKALQHKPDHGNEIAIWYRESSQTALPDAFKNLIKCPVSNLTWNGENIKPSYVYIHEASTIGVLGQSQEVPRVEFQFIEKPFCSDYYFYSQLLVASISFTGDIYGDDFYTLNPPYIPELNLEYSHEMHYEWNKLRIEQSAVGVVIHVTEKDAFIKAIGIGKVMENIFGLIGYKGILSQAGLIARQLIKQVGGLQGARVFKIPGVRRLINDKSALKSFSRSDALSLIGGKDPNNPKANFEDHYYLYVEAREPGTKLDAKDVFSYLVGNGIFRIGMDLKCPKCLLEDWHSIDSLKQYVTCNLCGYSFDSSRQLVNADWHYRKSGLIGKEKHSLGAIPVTLVLQQLDTNLFGSSDNTLYTTSHNLIAKEGTTLDECEIDFIWMIKSYHPKRTQIILAECKANGWDNISNFKKDIDKLQQVASALPRNRFQPFILLSKLREFTQEEIDALSILPEDQLARIILLTDIELEPYHFYERRKEEYSFIANAGTPEDMVRATRAIFFNKQKGK